MPRSWCPVVRDVSLVQCAVADGDERFCRSQVLIQELPEQARNFCANCGGPGPWLTRTDLLASVKNNLRASRELASEDRQKLIVMLDRLDALDSDDINTVAVWQRLKSVAPKVWDMTRPVRDTLIGEAVKRVFGL